MQPEALATHTRSMFNATSSTLLHTPVQYRCVLCGIQVPEMQTLRALPLPCMYRCSGIFVYFLVIVYKHARETLKRAFERAREGYEEMKSKLRSGKTAGSHLAVCSTH